MYNFPLRDLGTWSTSITTLIFCPLSCGVQEQRDLLTIRFPGLHL